MPSPHHTSTTSAMPQHNNAQPPSAESKIQLALQAIERDATLSQRRVAKLYSVPQSTLSDRLAGITSRRDCRPNAMKLTKTEESVIVEHILNLDARGFPPRLAAVKAMADSLLAERHRDPVGVNWASTFVKRQPELKVKFNRKYDYRRAKCEDPEVIRGWFRLVENTKAKYGITDEDSYNFDESGFMMGIISTGAVVTGSERRSRPKQVQPGNREWTTVIQGINAMGWAVPPFIIFAGKCHLSAWYKEHDIPPTWAIRVTDNGWTTNEVGLEWLEHFDMHTKDRAVGTYRLLLLDGHESHDSLQFQQLCEQKRIITLCMPSHSSHLLQPLDVGCFSSLKKAYGQQVENLMRSHISHITKIEFLPCFKAAFDTAITESNIKASFRGAGLVPLDPEAVISKLDVRLRTPTPPTTNNSPWESRTPSNTIEFGSQSKLVRERIQRHVDSSPTSIVDSLDQLTKGAEVMMHSAVLLRKQVAELQATNEAATRRRYYKKKRLQKDGKLTFEEGARLTALKESGACNDREKGKKKVRVNRSDQRQRRCGQCGETGHNARTCKNKQKR